MNWQLYIYLTSRIIWILSHLWRLTESTTWFLLHLLLPNLISFVLGIYCVTWENMRLDLALSNGRLRCRYSISQVWVCLWTYLSSSRHILHLITFGSFNFSQFNPALPLTLLILSLVLGHWSAKTWISPKDIIKIFIFIWSWDIGGKIIKRVIRTLFHKIFVKQIRLSQLNRIKVCYTGLIWIHISLKCLTWINSRSIYSCQLLLEVTSFV